MKKLYSTMMMLAMMVAALSFTACGGSDDDENEDGGVDGGGMPVSGDYIRITLDGKSYSDKILDWHYLQVDPVGKDSNNKPLTFTYDMRDHFDNNGFSFLFGVVHFSRMNELLASSPGVYGCSKDMLSEDYYRNLTFWSSLEIDYDEYTWVSGTHQVKSIHEVNGRVQIEGSFTSNFELDGKRKNVKGDYRITIP